MTTESDFTRFSGSLSSFKFDDETLLPFPDQFVDANSAMDNPLLTPDTEPCNSAQYSDGDFLADDNEFSESVFKYISQMLMEEDMEEQQILPDPLALQAAEKSLHQVLDGNLPSSTNHYPSYINSPDDSYHYSGNSSDYGALSSSDYSTTISNGGNGNSFVDFAENDGSASPPVPQHYVFQSSTTNPPLFQPSSDVFFSARHANKMVDSLMDQTQFPNFSTQSELMSQFQKGVEEASKFLPNLGNQWFTDLDKVSTFNLPSKEIATEVKIEEDNEIHHDFSNGFREKKNHEREDAEIEGRSTKQPAVDLEEIELSEMFDKMFIFPDHHGKGERGHCKGPRTGPPRDAEATEEQTPKTRPKKPVNTNANKEVVDLRMLLILAAQAVNTDDRRTAHEYLKQIRQHSSPLGDGSQRMAHYFANGLEARLDGNGSQIYNALASKRISPIDVLKAYQVYLSVCPFQKLANIFSNNKILNLAEHTKSLHIIDFGILYGFQWPALIFRLSKRPGGPPRLRITGIELPDRGFRPAERVQQTGRHLAKCCERFKVPFEYNGIAQKWETICIEDLKLREQDVVVVNCMFRFKNLLDQTVVLNNPRDSVLNLVKSVNPKLFTQSIVNGSYGVPFFVTRFREALFHYSALFDSLDANLPSDNPMRMMFEKEWYGREVLNVIACEGSERVERPETYKRWQIRNVRVGFKQVSLDPMIMRKLRFKLKGGGYNDDFVIDEDGEWMLQGWKGRIVYASSYWVVADV